MHIRFYRRELNIPSIIEEDTRMTRGKQTKVTSRGCSGLVWSRRGVITLCTCKHDYARARLGNTLFKYLVMNGRALAMREHLTYASLHDRTLHIKDTHGASLSREQREL